MTTQAVRGEKGIALLAVLVTLALMITLIGPFLISMTQSGEAAEYEASERESRVLVRGLRDSALQFVAQSQGSADPTPRFDSSNEIPRRWTPPSLPGEDGQRASDEKPLGERRPVGVDLLDVNARIFAPTMPQQIWANHFGWYAVLSEDLEIDEEERMAIQGGEQLPDSGFVWLGNECIRYERKGFGTLEGLTRGWSPQGQVEPNTVPDPYGPKTPHASGQMMHDMRVRLLATWAFDPGYGARAGQRERFLPFQSVEEIVRVDSETFGEIPREGLEELGELLVFDSARVHGGAFGKEERVFSAIEPGITTRLAVKDATSFPAGTVVHVSVQEQSEWALVIGMGNGSRGSSAQLPLGGATLLLDRPLRLQAPEEQARIRPLLPVPVNINTCSEQVLALMIEGVRTRRFRSQHGVVSYPLSRQKAKQIAERIYLSRSYDPDADVEGELPFENWQALHKRVLEPMRDEELLSNPELFHLYALFMNGIEHRLEQGGVPISYESSGLVEYRAAAAVLSGIGETLARREVTGLALPQPERSVERFYVSQEDFDEASRLARSRPYWSTGPIATNVRPDRSYSEPPDPSIAHLMPWVHGKSARFPSTEAQDSQAMLATNRIPDYGRLSYGNGFPEADHPEGLDLRQQEAPAIKSSVSVTNPTALAKTIMDGVRQGQVPVIPMAMQVTGAAGNAGTGRGGLGLAFGISAWWKPYSMRESILFDVNGGNPFRNRIFLTMDSGGLTLRMYDSAGQDPAPGNTSPEETALRWIVEPGTAALQENLWFHTAVEIAGGTPSGVALFTDGALLGKPAFLTRTTGGLGELQLEPRHDVPFFRLIQDSASTIGAEDSSTFPERGVLRYGNELIEYSGRSGGSFNLKIEDSIGGRMARGTFRLQRPGNNDPSTGATVQNLRVTAPSHPSNSSISLYGYSNPIVEDAFVVPGKASLLGTLGRWAPARVTVGPDDVILTESARSISLGKGLDRDTQSAELQLGPADGTSKGKVTGFDSAGGYAVLVQRHYLWQGPTVGATETRIEEEVGGVELVRYSGFNGSTIRITRGNLNLGTLPISRSQGAAQTGANDAPYLRSRHFVTEWNKGIFSNQSDPNDEETMWCYLVPVSIAISPGMTLPDPAELGHSEWLQIYNAADENLTEWVRYDKLVDGRYAMRIHPDALGALQNVLTTNNSQLTKQPGARGPYEVDTGDRGLIEPPRSGWPRIGEPNSEENALDYTCRLRFCFRGDPYTGTATHDQSNADVLPVFRTVLGSLELGRPGRGDRVALLTGANSAQASAGEPEWQQVNWSARHSLAYARSVPMNGSFSTNASDPGGVQCNLVALKDGVQFLYQGVKLIEDTRLMDRMVKFPSGELPGELGQTASLGKSDIDSLPFDGLVDNLQGYLGRSANLGSSGRPDEIFGRVVAPVGEGDTTWRVAFPQRRVSVNGAGSHGLLLVGGEVVGFTNFDRGNAELTIASNGRGLLGTKASAHDVGTPCYWISSRPASYLQGDLQPSSDSFLVANGQALAAQEGTVLIGRELIHYCWSRSENRSGPTLLQMPIALDPDADPQGGGNASRGLFRGRYGTTPSAHGDSEMVIAWPFRYWDRYSPRADDPELAFMGFSYEQPDIFATHLVWDEEIPDATLDLVLLVRADERVPWSADPASSPFLWRFDDPRPQDGTEQHRLLAQASRWDFRFHVLYKAGAFDAENWNASGWKRTAALKSFAWEYEAETRILRERETSR